MGKIIKVVAEKINENSRVLQDIFHYFRKFTCWNYKIFDNIMDLIILIDKNIQQTT